MTQLGYNGQLVLDTLLKGPNFRQIRRQWMTIVILHDIGRIRRYPPFKIEAHPADSRSGAIQVVMGN